MKGESTVTIHMGASLDGFIEKKDASDPAVQNEVIQLPLPARYQAPGHYPTAYRIQWDSEAREYRIALTQLQERN